MSTHSHHRPDARRAPDRQTALGAALRAHTPADAQEAAHRERMLALLSQPDDVFDRRHFAPGHFTASAFVLSPGRDALLLILHGKLGLWLQPGGHVEPADADTAAAAEREAREETGLSGLSLLSQAPFDLDVHDIPPHRDQPGHAHFDVRYLFVADDLRVAAGSDAKDARFFALDAVSEQHSDRSVMRAVDKLRGLAG